MFWIVINNDLYFIDMSNKYYILGSIIKDILILCYTIEFLF